MNESNSLKDSLTQSEEVNLKKYMVWRRVPKTDVNTIKKNENKNVASTKQNKSIEDGIVPMIPNKFWLSKNSRKDHGKNEKVSLSKQALNNPLVPLGMLATTGCLIGMCVQSLKRNCLKAQYYMRGRIAAQFFTFAVLFGGAWRLSKMETENEVSPPSNQINQI